MSLRHANELVFINNDPNEFRYYSKDFKKSYGDTSMAKKYIRQIVNQGTALTQSFLELVKNRVPELYQQALKNPAANDYAGSIKGVDRQRFEKELKKYNLNINTMPTSVKKAKNENSLNPLKEEGTLITGEKVEDTVLRPREIKEPVSVDLSKVEVDRSHVAAQGPVNNDLESALKVQDQAQVQKTLDAQAKLTADLKARSDPNVVVKLPASVDESVLHATVTTDEQEQAQAEYSPEETVVELKKEEVLLETGSVQAHPSKGVTTDDKSDFTEQEFSMVSGGTVKTSTTLFDEEVDRIFGEMQSSVDGASDTTVSSVSSIDSDMLFRVIREVVEAGVSRGVPRERIRMQLVSKGLDGDKIDGFDELFDAVLPEVSDPVVPEVANVGPGDFAVEAVPIEHKPRYHLSSILFYFGSTERPDWDPELEANVFSSGLSKEEIVRNSDAVIAGFGPKLFIFARKSETLEEFHELIQLQFCCLRDLARGPRTKNAFVPISSLTDFAAKLTPQTVEVPAPVPVDDDVLESVSQVGPPLMDLDTGAKESEVAPVLEASEQRSNQVQVTPSQAFKSILDNYRERPFDASGKPRFNQDIIDQTKIHRGNIIGPNNQQDPTQNYVPAFRINTRTVKSRS